MADISKFKRAADGAEFNLKDATARSLIANKQDTLTFDTTPTSGSTNPVTSGGIYTALDNAINGRFTVVQTLPTQDISTSTIYLVPKTDSETQNAYDEYLYIDNAWEKIGETTIDLSGYQPLLTFDSAPTVNSTNPVTSGGVYTALSGKADSASVRFITSANAVLQSSSWSNSQQTINVTGVTANSDVIIGLAPEAESVIDAAAKAKLIATAQGSGTVTIKACGTVPTVHIPLTVMIIN